MKEYSLNELASLTSSKLVGRPEHKISGAADLEHAQSHEASFLANSRYLRAMQTSKAGVVFIDSATQTVEGINFLICPDPSNAFQKVLDLFYADKDHDSGFSGIHPTAIIHPSAKIGNNVQMGPYVVIAKAVTIGDNTSIGANTYIGPYVQLGCDCLIHPGAVIREYCVIGKRVILQPGVVIGSCGFGYTTDKYGKHTKLTQTGNVIIEDDVEIGANTTIDRGRLTSTRIGRGSKIDNLVQIAHGVSVGEDNIIVSQTGIAGSSKTGKNVILAGQCGVVDHVTIADQVIVGAQSGVSKSLVEKGGKYVGSPATPFQEHHRQHVQLKNLSKYLKRIEVLEAKLKALEDVR